MHKCLKFPMEQILDDSHFISDLGGDSLQVLSVSIVEDMFSVLIPTEEYNQCVSVNALADIISAHLKGESSNQKRQLVKKGCPHYTI